MSRFRRLRLRVMAAFALAGLVVVASLSVLTYFMARTYLLNQKQSSAIHQAQANAQLVSALLQAGQPSVDSLLSSIQTPNSAQSTVLYSSKWYGTSPVAGPSALPDPLEQAVVHDRQASEQRYHQSGSQVLGVGLPLGEHDAYFEIFSLADLGNTLSTLRDALAAGSAVGFAVSLGIGAWASGRALKPVRDIGRAAAAISAGQFDARLDAHGDGELVELATSFNSMVDTIETRIERDARFASDVSHELRSPLTTLGSAAEVLERHSSQFDASARRALDLLAGEVRRFQQLVEDLLEISRYDAGVAYVDLEPVDLTAVTAASLAEAGQADAMPPPGPVVVMADRRRLQQALRNVIDNAVRYAAGVHSTSVTLDEPWALIAVEDRGTGIPAADRDRIFNRFARGTSAGQRGSGAGAGLGLALVDEHLRIQGGEVHVEDASPRGTRFVLKLPARTP